MHNSFVSLSIEFYFSNRSSVRVNAETLWQVMSAGNDILEENESRAENQFTLSDLMLNLAQVRFRNDACTCLPGI